MSPAKNPNHHVWAILVAGGKGNRYSSTQNKLLELLDHKPVIVHSLKKLTQSEHIEGVTVVCHPEWENDYRNALSNYDETQLLWCHGGQTRRESVYNGLKTAPDHVTIVAIHDAARPLVSCEKINQAIRPVLENKAIGTTLGYPLQNSLKSVKKSHEAHLSEEFWVDHTVNREQLWQIHTPQVFTKESLLKAHQTVTHNQTINDDCQLVELFYKDPSRQNGVILMVKDSPSNIKITHTHDLHMAQALLNQQHKLKTAST